MANAKLSLALVTGYVLTNLAYAQQRTSATFDDWTVSCAIGTPPATQMACDMSQSQKMEGQANPTTLISLSRADKQHPYKITAIVPSNVWVLTGIRVVIDDQVLGTAAIKWCLPNRCLAETDLTDDALKKLRGRSDAGKLEFKEASQRDVSMPISFRGFGQALAFMEKQ